MSAPVGTIVTLGLLSCGGFATYSVLPPEVPGDIPWKDLAGGGSAVLMFSAIVVFLRFLAAERQARDALLSAERDSRAKERDAERQMLQDLTTKHAETIEGMGATQMALMREIVANHKHP